MNSSNPRTTPFRQSLREFFYAVEVPYGLALIRIILPLILLCVVLPRWSHTRELYASDGAPAPITEAYGYPDLLPVPSGTVAVGLMTALTFCLVAASIGWHTRWALCLSWGLFTYLNMLDCLSTLTKYSVISSHVLLLLCVSQCGSIWSVDAWRDRRSKVLSPRWPRRLIQLLIGLIYFGAALTKLHTAGFAGGDQIRYWLLTNINNDNPIGEVLAMYPAVIVCMAHIALIFQVVFIFVCWRGRGRVIMLSLGAAFHLSTIWLLGLFIFPPIMLATYLAWLNENDVSRARSFVARHFAGLHRSWKQSTRGGEDRRRTLARRGSVLSSWLFATSLAATCLAGLLLEHKLDIYGERRIEGQYVLQPMSPERYSELFASHSRMREADKFFSLELGTDTLGGAVVNRKLVYAPGECVLAQCTLVPPHEDLVVTCSVVDAHDNEVHSARLPATRDMLRLNFTYRFPADIRPGDYRFVITSKGERVMWRDVRVEGTDATVATR